jgi:mRNA deadenylase 3'-5' endonuclease subunit Ccr4
LDRKIKLINKLPQINYKVITWNILAPTLWNDKENPIPLWKKRWSQIKKHLIELKADIICLQ